MGRESAKPNHVPPHRECVCANLCVHGCWARRSPGSVDTDRTEPSNEVTFHSRPASASREPTHCSPVPHRPIFCRILCEPPAQHIPGIWLLSGTRDCQRAITGEAGRGEGRQRPRLGHSQRMRLHAHHSHLHRGRSVCHRPSLRLPLQRRAP